MYPPDSSPSTSTTREPASAFADALTQTLCMLEALGERLQSRIEGLEGTSFLPLAVATGASMPSEPLVAHEPDYGCIKTLLEDTRVNDILINGHREIYVETGGTLQRAEGIAFESEEELATLARQIAQYCGRIIDPLHPCVDARLPDGSRVNIVIPPAAVDGISMSIRKFSGGGLNLRMMVDHLGMNEQMAEFLRCAARACANIIVSGGTGAGKTTLLNAIAKHIPHNERVVTIEDSAELQLPIPHVVRLEAVDNEARGLRSVTIRDLLRNALRMRPNRIIVGEVRGAEAFDMIQAMNTGHDGSLTTIHANTPRDALSRLENMVGMSGIHLPTSALRKQIAAAIHLIVQAERGSDGHRHVSKITEIVGIEGDVITMQDLFTLKEKQASDGTIVREHSWSGVFPRHAKLNALIRETGVMKLGIWGGANVR